MEVHRYKPIIIQIETEEKLNVKLISQVFILDCLKTDERHKVSTIKMIILLFNIQCFFSQIYKAVFSVKSDRALKFALHEQAVTDSIVTIVLYAELLRSDNSDNSLLLNYKVIYI